MPLQFDVAILGAGISGLALAYVAANAGQRVIVFDRMNRAEHAYQHFGLIWPIAQPPELLDQAMRTRETWLKLSDKIGYWTRAWGSLHPAYQEAELHVLEEFIERNAGNHYRSFLLTPEESVGKSRHLNPIGLEGALYSSTEVNIDPNEAARALIRYLEEELDVQFQHDTCAQSLQGHLISDGRQEWWAERIFIAGIQDFSELFPQHFADSELVPLTSSILKTQAQPKNWTLGPNLASAYCLSHYPSFKNCLSLELLRRRQQRLGSRRGRQLLISQTRTGCIQVGDSFEFTHLDMDEAALEGSILQQARKLIRLPNTARRELWSRPYYRLPDRSAYILHPQEHVSVLAALGSSAMTLCFGLAHDIYVGSLSR